ncbi:MAG: helix-turn-helix transcriptional regulator [Anaerovorax sp.]
MEETIDLNRADLDCEFNRTEMNKMDAQLDYKAIGKRICSQRKQKGYTREKLAEKIGVSPKFCADIEYGLRGMSLKTLMKLSKELNLSLDYIIKGPEGYTLQTGEDAHLVRETILEPLSSCSPKQLEAAKKMIKFLAQAVNEGEKDE